MKNEISVVTNEGTFRGGARNFLPGGLSPPYYTFSADTKPYSICFKKFQGGLNFLSGGLSPPQPTPAAATRNLLR